MRAFLGLPVEGGVAMQLHPQFKAVTGVFPHDTLEAHAALVVALDLIEIWFVSRRRGGLT